MKIPLTFLERKREVEKVLKLDGVLGGGVVGMRMTPTNVSPKVPCPVITTKSFKGPYDLWLIAA